MNKTSKKLIASVIVSVMCFTLFSFGASAVSLDEKGSVTLTVVDKETREPVSDATFRLYMIASAYVKDSGISYIYTDKFKNSGMDIDNFSDAYFPVHLMVYAKDNEIPFEEKTSDSSGKVSFENLQCGAYLVVPSEIEEGYINPLPFIVTVPTKNNEQNKWLYDIDASPKLEADKEQSGSKTYISVKKIWKTTEKTPDSIKASLVKDGEIVASIVLNAENNWYHKWKNLDQKHSWSVIETGVPSGYKVSYVASQMTVIITNTSDNYKDEPTTNPENTTNPDELVDAGQLNWPVPAFSVAGLIFFSIGWAMLNLGKKDEETA